jgi:uncharacterized repeat protein (TIGR01451 family)
MKTKRIIPIIIVVTAVLLFAIIIVMADVTTTYTVYPGNMQDWQTQTIPGAQPTPASTPYVSFVNGPATPPLGSGSAELGVGSDGSAFAQLRQPDYAGTVLPNPSPDPDNPNPAGNELTELRYSTYVQVGGSASQAPYIILDVDYDNNGTVDDHLVFEPQYQIAGFCPSNPQGPVATGVWQTWDAFNGCWYSTGGVAGSGPGANVKPLSAFTAAQPNAKIVNSGSNGGVRIVTGGGGVIGGGSASDWSDFVGNVDDFRIGVGFDPDNGPIVTEYDFEPAPPPPPSTADIGVFKQVNAAQSFADRDVTYTITVTNAGPDAAANATLTDMLPGDMTFVSLSNPAGWSCSTPVVGSGGTIICTNASLAVTNGQVFTLAGHIPSGTLDGTDYFNTATVSTSTQDFNNENDSSSADTTVTSCFSNLVVTTNADSGPGSLRQAIADACDGSTVSFDMTQVTSPITLTSGELLINKNLTIAGPGANLLSISGNNQSRVFNVGDNTTVHLDGITVTLGNQMTGESGGGILVGNHTTLTITNSAITNNKSTSRGGGISLGESTSSSSTLNLVNSTVSGNSAQDGGGVAGRGATMNIVNSTISGNTVNMNGGGIWNYFDSSTLNITNSTIAANTSLLSGGISGVNGSATVKNSIIAANINNASHPDVGDTNGGTFISQGYNLIGNPGSITSFNQTGDQTGNSTTPLNPMLGTLQNNGGPTQTMLPLPGSPAINAGNPGNLPPDTFDLNNNGNTTEPLPVDQRGFTRVVGSGFDIGAVEVQAGTPDHLAFSVQPSSTTPGAIITPAVKVQILDVTNSLVTTSNANVTVAIGNNPSGGTLSGTTSVAAVNGVATFSDLSINNVGGGYTLTANSTGLVGATSNSFNVLSPAIVTGTKTVSGTFNVGSTITYTVMLNNSGPAAQLDNPGNEFTDVLPTGLTLVSATATSGTAVATTATNTVSWNGSIPSGNSVTITIQATIKSGQEGQTISNQGTIAYDADGNGTNESTNVTGTAANNTNPTSFHVNAPPTISAVGVTRTAGSPSANSTIANVSDAEDAKNTLAVTVNNGSTATTGGVTVSNLSVSSAGVVTADVVAACGATTANFTLKVTDSGGLSSTTSLPVTVNANPAPTLTYSSPQSVNFGDSLTVNPATGPSDDVSVSSIVLQSKGTYTGNISVNNTTGVVSISNAAPGGTHTITIRATDNCGTTTDASFNLTVAKVATTTGVTSSVNPSDFGQSVTFTATVTSSAGIPSGTVQFKDNGNNLGSAATLVNGVATLTTSALTVGTHPITADYSGDANFLSSSGTLAGGQVVRSQPTLSINDVTQAEANSGTTDFNFTVTLSAASNLTVTVNYATADGTAKAGTDYQSTSGTLTFNPGDTSKPITVTVIGHSLNGTSAFFTVNLSNPTNATISKGQGVGTIQSQSTSLQFSATSYTVNEGDGHAIVTINRLGDTSQPASINYATSDQSFLNPCSQVTGLASQRCDYAITIGKLNFAAGDSSKQIFIPIIDDAYTEGPETFTLTLSNPTGGVIQGNSSTTITIVDNDAANGANPLDQDSFFIRELYIDFLDREPDPPGLQGWLNILHSQCQVPTDCDRIAVALGFVNSPEFTDRGYFIYKLYKTLPDASNPTFGRIPHYFEFTTDMAKVSGFLSSNDLNAAKDAFIAEFMTRSEFMTRYNPSLNDPTGYVDALLATVNLPNHPTRNTWIAGLTNGTLSRGQVLRQLVESAEVNSRFKNEAFVIMNYFGFLRRDADAAYTTWIQLFNDTDDQRLIINGFINSPEYRQRFAP